MARSGKAEGKTDWKGGNTGIVENPDVRKGKWGTEMGCVSVGGGQRAGKRCRGRRRAREIRQLRVMACTQIIRDDTKLLSLSNWENRDAKNAKENGGKFQGKVEFGLRRLMVTSVQSWPSGCGTRQPQRRSPGFRRWRHCKE